MTVSGKDKRGLVEELRTLRTRLDRLERRNAELVHAEKELRESLEQFKTIFDNTLVGLYRTTPDGRILMANSVVVNMLGYSSFDELARRNLENEGYEPQYPRSVFKERIEREGKVIGLESAWKRSDGTTLYVRESAQAVRDESGKTLYYQGTVEDITEHRRTKRALHESEELFVALSANLSEGVNIVDENLCCLFANPAGEKIFGVEPGGLAGRNLREFVSGEGHALLEKEHSKRREGIASSYDLEITRPDGRKRQLIVTATPRFSEDGKYAGALAVFFDVTEKSEAALMSIFRAAPVGIGLECGRVLSRVNDQICAMLGYSRDELVGRDARMFYPSEEDYQRARNEKHRQIRERGTATVETRWKRKDGRIIDILLSTAVLDAADFSKGVTFTALDVTERKRAEEALKESEEKFRSLAEQSPNMIFINKKGKIVYANKRCEEIMGYPREQLYSPDFSFLSLIAPESIEMIKELFARHSKGEEIRPYDYSLIDKQGRRIEAINSSKLIHYEGQTAILGIVTDITEHKKAEGALRESQERLKILFESAPDAIYLTDLKGRFVDGNRAAEELVGFAKAELIGKSLAESGLLSAEQLPQAAANLQKVAAGKPSGPSEYTVRRKSGSLIVIEVRTFPVRISDQVLSLGIARDVTERKQAQQKLLNDREQLKLLASALSLTEERERRRLATELHDQIGQSLVISKIKLDQLRKNQSSGELSGALDEVSSCLGQVINETRTLTFDLSYPILYELGFEAAVAEWLTEHIQEEHGIETDFEDDGQSKPLDDDIRTLLFRNVRELLINVVKHARARRVKVTTRRVKDHIRISVEDDGVGFDPVEVAAMAANRAEFGLFSIRERLEQLGGLFEVVSAPGRGTRVTMTAPLKYKKKEA
jgi:PAS domain S-box-containing protein